MTFEGILFGVAAFIGYKFYEEWVDLKKKINEQDTRSISTARNIDALVEYTAANKKRDEETAASVRMLVEAVKRGPPT